MGEEVWAGEEVQGGSHSSATGVEAAPTSNASCSLRPLVRCVGTASPAQALDWNGPSVGACAQKHWVGSWNSELGPASSTRPAYADKKRALHTGASLQCMTCHMCAYMYAGVGICMTRCNIICAHTGNSEQACMCVDHMGLLLM